MDLPVSTFSVVIPTHNGKEYLRRCLNALRQSAVKPEKIIVVDDASTDGTEEMVRNEFPDAKLVRNHTNCGPTASRNRGAQKAEGDFIVFIDNDILVRPASLKQLIDCFRKVPNVGMAGGMLITSRNQPAAYTMGPRPSMRGAKISSTFSFLHDLTYLLNYRAQWWARMIVALDRVRGRYDRIAPVGWIIESFIAVPRHLFEKVGGFDDEYFMFFEGPDLSERLRNAGYLTYFVPDAVVDVLEGHTHSHKLRRGYWKRSSSRFLRKHFLKSI
jgi:GT2 family glycosyltransferase